MTEYYHRIQGEIIKGRYSETGTGKYIFVGKGSTAAEAKINAHTNLDIILNIAGPDTSPELTHTDIVY